MNRKFSFAFGEFYHLYNRGTDKRTIFLDEEDHDRFISLMFLCNSDRSIVYRDIPIGLTYGYERGGTLVDILAYCLMPNHFHMLICGKNDGSASLFMQKFLTAYTMYFNRKYKRTGALFEGTFKAKHADTDEYLKYLFAYIHLNPVKLIDPNWKEFGIQNRVAAQAYLAEYKHSSYIDWQGKTRDESRILNREAVPEYFTTPEDFNDFVNEWLTFPREE